MRVKVTKPIKVSSGKEEREEKEREEERDRNSSDQSQAKRDSVFFPLNLKNTNTHKKKKQKTEKNPGLPRPQEARARPPRPDRHRRRGRPLPGRRRALGHDALPRRARRRRGGQGRPGSRRQEADEGHRSPLRRRDRAARLEDIWFNFFGCTARKGRREKEKRAISQFRKKEERVFKQKQRQIFDHTFSFFSSSFLNSLHNNRPLLPRRGPLGLPQLAPRCHRPRPSVD